MDWHLFLSTFLLIFVAELPDKTAFATVLMATRGNPRAVFVGVASAFVVQTGVAILFGSVFGLLPQKWVLVFAALLFFAFAATTWLRKEEKVEGDDSITATLSFGTVAWKSFLVIFIAEWGDITQLATASLQAKFHAPWTLFSAAICALWIVTAIAVFAGNRLKGLVNPRTLNRVSAAAFVGAGVYFLHQAIANDLVLCVKSVYDRLAH